MRKFTLIGTVAAGLVVVLLTFTSCQKKSQTESTAGKAAGVGTATSADGVEIRYEVRGSGTPVLVFVHGWCCDRTYWNKQMDHFSSRVKVVAVDLAGHGESGSNRKEWTMGAFGDDVAAVVNKLNLSRVVLVGHSMGGPVIIEAAKRLPGRVIGLVGVDTFQDLGRKWTDDELEKQIAPLRENFVEGTMNFVHQMYPEGADSALVAKIATDVASASPEVGLACMEGVARFDAAAAVQEVRLPIISINSDMWPTNLEGNKEIAASFDLILMPGLGHWVMIEDPETFNLNLTAAVQTLVRGSATQ